MSSKDEKLIAAKNRLCATLGEEKTKTYMSNMKMWFRKLWKKEEFDSECRKLFTSEQKHLHNEFFLAILNKISIPVLSQTTQPMHVPSDCKVPIAQISRQTSLNHNASVTNNNNNIINSSKKRKRSSRSANERAVFEPIDLYDFLPEDDSDVRMPSTPLPQPRFAAQELFLPDNGLILGRLLVAAWENGLSNADENVCELIVLAVQAFLKNILTAILRNRKHYKCTNGGSFFYDVGCALKNPYIRNTATRQIIDDHPFEVDKEISTTNILQKRTNDDSLFLAECETLFQTPIKGRITIVDLFDALQDRNVVPCHSVYANNIERISQMLN